MGAELPRITCKSLFESVLRIFLFCDAISIPVLTDVVPTFCNKDRGYGRANGTRPTRL